MPALVRLSERAVRDLAKLGKGRPRVLRLLSALAQEPRPANLDIRALRGHEPWPRARVGPYRAIFRPLTADEARVAVGSVGRAYLVVRVIHRRDLERAIATL